MSEASRSRPNSYQRLGSVPELRGTGTGTDNSDNVQREIPFTHPEHVEHGTNNDTVPIVDQVMTVSTQYSQPHEPQEPQAYHQISNLAVSAAHNSPQIFPPPNQQFVSDQKTNHGIIPTVSSHQVVVPMDQFGSSQPFATSTSRSVLQSPPEPYGNLPPPDYSGPQKGYPPESTAIEMSPFDGQDATRIAANLQTDKMVRLAFVRKVYGLLTAQLAVTIAISFWFVNDASIKTWVNDHQWLFFVSWGLALLDLCLLYWLRQKHPWNLILLFVFTLCISYSIATVVSVYDTRVVLQAFMITFGVFLALVVFTLQSKINFESWGPFLYAFLWVVIFAGFIAWLFPFDRGYHVAISGLSALLFSGYIIYDTYMIFNKLSPEEYVLAAIDLYLDIINLFIAILALLGGTDS